MPGWLLSLLRLRLRRCGYHVLIFSYPSMRNTLSENAARLSRFVASVAAPGIHLAGHSMGGLVILQMLHEHSPSPRIRRIVLLGTPYHGGHAASALAQSAPGRWMLGRSMLQWLNQGKPGLADQIETGVIAGSRNLGIGHLVVQLPRPNDSVVAVEETRVPGAQDHIVLRVSHSGMLISSGVAKQICAFLKTGRFALTNAN